MFGAHLGDGAELRLLEPRHATALFAVLDANRDHLAPWLPWVDGTRSVDQVATFARNSLEQLWRDDGLHAGVFLDGAIVGVIGYPRIDWLDLHTSIGYWLAASAQGRGLATRATARLVSHAFDVWDLNRVEVRCAVANARSRRVPERLGFRHEGTLSGAQRVRDGFADVALYAITRDEWRARARPHAHDTVSAAPAASDAGFT